MSLQDSSILAIDPAGTDVPEHLFTPSPDAGEVVVVLAEPAARAGGWGPRLVAAIAREWSRAGLKVFLVDGGVESPTLHSELGVENGEGIADAIAYGNSPSRISRRLAEHEFLFASAGTVVADPAALYSDPRWKGLLGAFRESGATLILYLPAEAAGIGQLVSEGDRIIRFADEAPDGAPTPGEVVLHPAEGSEVAAEAALTGIAGFDSFEVAEGSPESGFGPEPITTIEDSGETAASEPEAEEMDAEESDFDFAGFHGAGFDPDEDDGGEEAWAGLSTGEPLDDGLLSAELSLAHGLDEPSEPSESVSPDHDLAEALAEFEADPSMNPPLDLASGFGEPEVAPEPEPEPGFEPEFDSAPSPAVDHDEGGDDQEFRFDGDFGLEPESEVGSSLERAPFPGDRPVPEPVPEPPPVAAAAPAPADGGLRIEGSVPPKAAERSAPAPTPRPTPQRAPTRPVKKSGSSSRLLWVVLLAVVAVLAAGWFELIPIPGLPFSMEVSGLDMGAPARPA